MLSDAILDRTFKGLTVEERGGLLEKAERLTFGPGEAVVKEGDKIESFYVVAKGEVRVTRHVDGTVSAEFIGPRGPGETLGEMSFVDGLGASANLIADGEVELVAIMAEYGDHQDDRGRPHLRRAILLFPAAHHVPAAARHQRPRLAPPRLIPLPAVPWRVERGANPPPQGAEKGPHRRSMLRDGPLILSVHTVLRDGPSGLLRMR